MKRHDYVLLLLLGLLSAGLAASFEASPGYMDADYYFAGGYRLARGEGLSEPFLWNYLDDPAGLPHPSHAYWMPLASFLAAAGVWLLAKGATVPLAAFAAGRLGFILVAACLPPLTARLAHNFGGRRSVAWLAGLLACCSGFYWPYLPTSDTFGLYMLLGGIWLWVAAEQNWRKGNWLRPAVLGALAGCMHLARADGLLWLAVSLGAAYSLCGGNFRRRGLSLGLCLAGYLLIMGPWMARNWFTFGTLLSPGGLRALWFTAYDELYAYPATLLTPERWWASGLAAIGRARLWALGLNVQTALFVQGEIFLGPLAFAGLWRLRRMSNVRWAVAAWLLTGLVMTVAFPYAGARGGFFHSGAALQPLIWAAAPIGLEAFVSWGTRRRGWQARPAMAMFGVACVLLAATVTGMAAARRLGGDTALTPAWDASTRHYQQLEQTLVTMGVAPQLVVMVNDPPGYYVATGRWTVANPNGDVETQLAVAWRYGVAYILLEADHPRALNALYEQPADVAALDYLVTVAGTHVFGVQSP